MSHHSGAELQAVLGCGEQSTGYLEGFHRVSGDSEGRASTGHEGTVRGGRPWGIRDSEGKVSTGRQGRVWGGSPWVVRGQ